MREPSPFLLPLPTYPSPGTLEGILQMVASVRALGYCASGAIVVDDIPCPRGVLEHPCYREALHALEMLWREKPKRETAIAIAEKRFAAISGGRERVDIAPIQQALPGSLVVHNHPPRCHYRGDLGPSPQDLQVLRLHRAAGLLLSSPGAVWIVAFDGNDGPEDLEVLEYAIVAGGRLAESQRWNSLRKLAAVVLTLIGCSWVRIPEQHFVSLVRKEVA